jgi:hypothetical protein
MNIPVEPTLPNPNEEQSVQPKIPDVEINPASPGIDTEVDLDKNKTTTYPPERH